MTKQEKIEVDTPLTGLDLLRAPFPPSAVSKLPKPTKAQTDAVKKDYKEGVRCKICNGWHHPKVVHLDYVGHAALTDRLLNCDPNWNWEPTAFDENGAPKVDAFGGMWIRLTVCGVTRLGYGHADGKKGGDAIKETIGDALRNAGMRFGAALDLWHKGDLHPKEDDQPPAQPQTVTPEQLIILRDKCEECGADQSKFLAYFGAQSLEQFPANRFAAAVAMLDKKIAEAKNPPISDDEIPY